MTDALQEGKSIYFYLKRLARIYPLHIVALLVVAVIAMLGIPHPISSGLEDKIFEHWQWTGVLNLTLMHGWGIVPVASWNEPAWTVSIMFLLYVIFPNLVLLIRRMGDKPHRFLAFLVFLIAGYFLLREWVGLGSHSDGMGAIARGVVFFIMGMAIARLHMLHWLEAVRWDWVLVGLIAIFLMAVALWWEWYAFDLVWFHMMYVPFILCLLRAKGLTSAIFANFATCWLGSIAYALYIMHYPVLLLIKHVLGNYLSVMAEHSYGGLFMAYAVTISIVIMVAWVMNRFVEQPVYQFAKRQIKKRDASAP